MHRICFCVFVHQKASFAIQEMNLALDFSLGKVCDINSLDLVPEQAPSGIPHPLHVYNNKVCVLAPGSLGGGAVTTIIIITIQVLIGWCNAEIL